LRTLNYPIFSSSSFVLNEYGSSDRRDTTASVSPKSRRGLWPVLTCEKEGNPGIGFSHWLTP